MAAYDVERQVALLLGAPEDVAEAAVAAISEHGLLEHGVLFLAVLGSARWGSDAVEALRRIAAGTEPPGNWSDYEARTAREEAEEEADLVLARLATADVPATLAEAVRAAVGR